MTATLMAVAFIAALNWPAADAVGHASPPATADADALPSSPSETCFRCNVAYVNDGDTLRCKDGTKIRLHAVAAREADETCSPGHPCPTASAASATAELNRLVAGKTLRCEQTGRSYDRITAIWWWPSGEEINCAMITSGTTLVWETFDRRKPLCGR